MNLSHLTIEASQENQQIRQQVEELLNHDCRIHKCIHREALVQKVRAVTKGE